MTVYVLLPCYNEVDNIEEVVAKVDRTLSDYRIVAVNDGSTDGTLDVLSDLARSYDLTRFEHEGNRGLPAALETGFDAVLAASKQSDDVVVTMDADDTQPPSRIEAMADSIRTGAGIAVGSRYVPGSSQRGVPLHRRILSRSINEALPLFTGIPVQDQTSGFRAYRLSILRSASIQYGASLITSEGFEVTVEILVKAYYGGQEPTVAELPFELRYDRKAGTSSIDLPAVIRNYVAMLPKIRRWRGTSPGR